MFRNHRARLLLLCCMASPLANAANVDLTTFTLTRGPELNSKLNATNAFLDMGSSVYSSLVTNIASFDWTFSIYSSGFVEAVFEAPALKSGHTVLANTNSLSGFGTTFWQTYTFATPYTGALTFRLIGPPEVNATVEFKNVAISAIPQLPSSPAIPAVPEPESYAMLIAGLGLMASIGRRRARRVAPGAVQA